MPWLFLCPSIPPMASGLVSGCVCAWPVLFVEETCGAGRQGEHVGTCGFLLCDDAQLGGHVDAGEGLEGVCETGAGVENTDCNSAKDLSMF